MFGVFSLRSPTAGVSCLRSSPAKLAVMELAALFLICGSCGSSTCVVCALGSRGQSFPAMIPCKSSRGALSSRMHRVELKTLSTSASRSFALHTATRDEELQRYCVQTMTPLEERLSIVED